MGKEFDIAIIGSGPAGYIGAIKAAQLGYKVVCIEKYEALGGTCLNVGCIPSKALLHASELLYALDHHGPQMGILAPERKVDFAKMMAFKEGSIHKLTSGIQYLFKKYKVERILGAAKFLDGSTLEVNHEKVKAKQIIIATGSEPIPLPFLPFDEKKILSSTGALSLKEIPKKMTIIGAGVIGLELGSIYARLGTKIEVVELLDRIIPEFDRDLSKAFQKTLESQGFTFHLKTEVKPGQAFDADVILVAIGRRAMTHNLNLEQVGIQKDPRGFIQIDHQFRTTLPNVYAIGDVACQPMLAHKGSEEALSLIETLFGHKVRMNYAAIPNVIYTSPEVASVGFTQEALEEKGVLYKVSHFPLIGNSRYQAIGGKDPCFVKTLSHKTTNHLLGCHILAPNASELIAQPTLAIQAGITVDTLASTCYAHPTLSEALHEAYLGLKGPFLHL